jgi:hypothetical protein
VEIEDTDSPVRGISLGEFDDLIRDVGPNVWSGNDRERSMASASRQTVRLEKCLRP